MFALVKAKHVWGFVSMGSCQIIWYDSASKLDTSYANTGQIMSSFMHGVNSNILES